MTMVSASEARRTILSFLRPVSYESCELSECLGRILAERVVAPYDVPGFDNSSMDGYAIRAADVHTAAERSPVPLRVQEEVGAGRNAAKPLAGSSAIRIMTGAPIPPGADAVIEQEMIEGKNGSITIRIPVEAGRNIRLRGDDIKAGDLVLDTGSSLTASRLGLLASLGKERLKVYQRPRVAFLTTGNELVGVTEELTAGKIRNSNAYSLAGLLRQAGCEPVNLGIARDDPDQLTEKIREGLQWDALVTSGGVSVGVHDHVLDALRSEQVEIIFWKVNVKPGMPFAFGIKKEEGGTKPVFALPGNPVSSVVTFLQFARYGLEVLRGNREFSPVRVKAVLKDEIRKKDRKMHFVRGIASQEGGELTVVTTGTQSSGVLTSLSKANCLIHVPEDAGTLPSGSLVEVEFL